jgi:phosphonate transport system substrate-binding protein
MESTMKRRIRPLLVSILFLLLMPVLAGTGQEKTMPPNPGPNSGIGSGTIGLPKPFIIALLPQRNIFEQKRRYQPLADYLSKTLGVEVRTHILDSYEAVYTEMLDRKVDAAFFGSLSYVVMDSKLDINPVARPLMKDGTSSYKGLILALADKGITKEIRTWKGKRIALVSRSTTAGYLFPKSFLRKNGIRDFERYFSKVIYTGSHDATLAAVLKGEVDIGCSSDKIFMEFTEKDRSLRGKFVILAASAEVPSNTLGIRSDLEPGLRELLKKALLSMDKTPEGRHALSVLGAVHFTETNKSEFGPIFEMLSTLGMKPGDFAMDRIGAGRRPALTPE